MDAASDWQHPFVDVFKRYSTYDSPRSYKGNVSIIHDPTIARKCFKLSGSIISNNSIAIPDPTSQTKHCNLIGRYIYVEMFAAPEKLFCMHFQIGVKDREPGVRFTLTNMEKEYSVSGGNTLKIPYPQESRNLWSIVCIDIEHHLQNFGLFSKGVIRNYSGVHTLRGIQLCANTVVRGIYTSSNVYDWESLPKQMSFKMVKGGRWSEFYNFMYLPKSIDPVQLKKKMKEDSQSMGNYGDLSSHIVEREESTQKKRKIDAESRIEHNNPHAMSKLQTQPLVQLSTAFSFSSLHNPDLIFKDNQIYYSAGSILIRKDVETGEQTFMQGHTDYIVAMDWHQNWIVSVQEGARSGVRIWIDNKCISSFQCPYEKVQQIKLSHKKHLAMVGLDPYKRQAILVFDISEIEITRKPVLLGKQISDFNIISLKFSPTDTNKLVSCGKQNIRFWRIKNQHLPGTPVVLNHHARNTVFTVFDFQYSFDDPNPLLQKSEIRRVYVGSKNGLLFQVNYNTHELQEVYKLYDSAAISSLVVSAGFCVTGSSDQLLRVWQMDFSEYILEAGNDGVVASLALNEDNTQVVCGTSAGTLSILDLTNNNFKTIVRSHTSNVTQIVYHSFSNCMITLSSDLTIRLWDADQFEQTYEFSYPSSDICTCISGNPNALQFAAGFKSGVLRIFDIQSTSVIQEITHHSNSIMHLEYSPDGNYLAVLEEKLNMLYSPLHSHQPIKHLPVQFPSKYKHCCFSEDSEQIAIIGDSGTHINLWELRILQMIGKIFTGKVMKKLKYEGDRLWCIFEDTSIRRYNIAELTIQVQMQALHRQNLNAIDFNLQDHLLYSVGDDSFVKVWDYSFFRQPHQVFIGHANVINDVIFKNGRLWSVGSEGVLVWDIKEPIQEFTPPPIFKKQKKAQFIRNNNYDPSSGKIKEQNDSNAANGQKNPQTQNVMKETREVKKPVMFSNLMKKTAGNDELDHFAPTKIDMKFVPQLVNLKKTKKREPKAQLTSKPSALNIKHQLPLKHFFQEELRQNQIQYTHKIQMMKQNSKKYSLEFLVGIEPQAHDHIVWNFMYGWYAYCYDNLIIVESLSKSRSQRIITMPQKIGSLTITNDFKKLICVSEFNPAKRQKVDPDASSEDASQASSSADGADSDKQCAGIYVLGIDLSIEKKFQFHPKGVQSISLTKNNKFLVSIGNFRECTVCVWDMLTGKLKASSYTLDKLNDIAIMQNCGEGRLLEFATVGRDQIHFWALTKDEKLEYYDVFIQKEEEDNEIPELTSCAYLHHDEESTYLVCGTKSGQIMLVRYGDFQVTWKRKICSGEILNIRCYNNRAVIGSADGNLYFWNYNTKILQMEPNPSFNKLNLYYSVTAQYFDEDGNEGVVATSEAVYYVSLNEQMHSLLIGGSPDHCIFVKNIVVNQQNYMLSSHSNGRVKLWNLDTAEELKTYKWRYVCTEAYYDEGLGKLICFCENKSIKLVNLKKFTKEENYLPEELVRAPEPKLDDWVVTAPPVQFNGRNSRWLFTRKGNVYDLQISLQGKKKVLKQNKVLQLNCKVSSAQVNSEKNLLLIVSTSGQVTAYNVDHGMDEKYSLLMVDRCPAIQFHLQRKNNKNYQLHNQLESDALEPEHKVIVQPSKVINETYLAICPQSQYLYFRNYMKRITFQKILLNSIPTSLLLRETKKQSQAMVGTQDGSIISLNSLQPEHRTRFEGIVNNQVESLSILKSKNWLVASHPNSMGMYSIQNV